MEVKKASIEVSGKVEITDDGWVMINEGNLGHMIAQIFGMSEAQGPVSKKFLGTVRFEFVEADTKPKLSSSFATLPSSPEGFD